MAIGIEDIDKTVAASRDIVMLRGILLGVRHKQITTNVLHAKWRKSRWNRGVIEATIRRDWFIVVIEDLDRPGAKIRSEEKDAVRVRAKHYRLVHCRRGG